MNHRGVLHILCFKIDMTDTTPAKTTRERRRRLPMIIGAILVALVIIAIAVVLIFRWTFPSGPAFRNLPVSGDSEVRTTYGDVRGARQDSVFRYLGIPYATADERFKPAHDVEPWDGVFEANAYGPTSPQGAMFGGSAPSDDTGTDNNCQNLNIWTPGHQRPRQPSGYGVAARRQLLHRVRQ